MDRKREQQLIQAAQKGDKRAFSALYRAYVDRIYQYIYYRVESSQMAEDLTADVFVRVLEGLPNYRDSGAPFLVWLYSIAHARVVDHYRRTRRSGRHESLDEIDVPAEAEDIDSLLDVQLESSQVRRALKKLTGPQQQVIILRFIQGYNLERTASLLNKSVDAVKAMQYRALQTLARLLAKQGLSSTRLDSDD